MLKSTQEDKMQDIGEGWMSKNASDLVKVATYFGGFDQRQLIRRLALSGNPNGSTNAATVARVLDEMYFEGQKES